ncbi:uncharacterized membrane protein (DUF485 family) [Paenibacillus sp. RC254]
MGNKKKSNWFKLHLPKIYLILYIIVVLIVGYEILWCQKDYNSLSELCKVLAQVFITIALGYIALFAGLAAIFYKHKQQFKTFREDLNNDFRSIAFFVVSSVIMLMFSYVKNNDSSLWFLTIIAITNQIAFVMINIRAFASVKKIMNIQEI